MHKKFEINWTMIKGGYHLGRKVVTHNSKSNLPLEFFLVESKALKHKDIYKEGKWHQKSPKIEVANVSV